MKTFFKKTKRFFTESTKVVLGVAIGVSLVVAGSVYAAVSVPPSESPGNLVQSSRWNEIRQAILNLDQRTEPITNSSGNLGVGTTTPSTGLKLDIEGKIGAEAYCDKDGTNCISAPFGGLWQANGTNISNTNAGNVGIGIANPTQKLEVNGKATSAETVSEDPDNTLATKGYVDALVGVPCSHIGDVCADGNIFVGTSPIENLPMYMTRCDVGQEFNSSDIANADPYGDDFGGCANVVRVPSPKVNTTYANWSSTAFNTISNAHLLARNAFDGKKNTSDIMTALPDDSFAAHACDDLVINGHNDYYLPSIKELQQIYSNFGYDKPFEIPGHMVGGHILSTVGGHSSYWSSTTSGTSIDSSFSPFVINMRGGDVWKGSSSAGTANVRCLRRGTPN